YIGSKEVVNNDGNHGAQERSGFVALKQGMHPIRVMHYNAMGVTDLEVSYKIPDGDIVQIPAEALWRQK
ncbi:MAG: beta-glucosidase, partial [Candidatus Latescibacteria bacterium]|nr:beta-glucosidase [Candidatus Latescibacterota bacterium]